MTKIGLLSDTHSHFDPRFLELFSDVDEIWHAGDIGDIKVLDALRAFKPTRAVWGNIDNAILRAELSQNLRFRCEEVEVWLTHIGGYPKKYDALVREEIKDNPPQLFVCGHSHILKVIYDKELDLLHMNPGASGISGFHSVRTALRFTIDGADIKDLEVIELGPKRVKGVS